MTTLDYNDGPASRIHAGDAVLAAAKTARTGPIAARVDVLPKGKGTSKRAGTGAANEKTGTEG